MLGSHVNSIGVLLNDLAKDAHNLPDSAEPTLRNLVESLGRAEKLVEKCASRSAFGSFMTSRDTKEEFNQARAWRHSFYTILERTMRRSCFGPSGF